MNASKIFSALFIFIFSFLLQSCGARYLISTNAAYNGGVSKEKKHYIVPPKNNFSIDQKNLYPMVKSAMSDSGIKLVNRPSEADYIVGYLSFTNYSSYVGTRYLPTQSTTIGQANVGGYPYKNINYSQTTYGGTYVPHSYDTSTISYVVMVSNEDGEVWRGSASSIQAHGISAEKKLRGIFENYGIVGERWAR
ncbi:MAG: hypothetical protein RL346_1266 [Verrucomicrobiota bacterium]|jgi:hypothetical protein